MKHGVIHDYSLPCKSSPFAVYGIWHQYIADISSYLDRDWNYFSWICWKISILTAWVCQSVVQVATQGHEIPCMGNSLVGTPGLAGFFLILRENWCQISLGPMRFLTNHSPESVFCHHWLWRGGGGVAACTSVVWCQYQAHIMLEEAGTHLIRIKHDVGKTQ